MQVESTCLADCYVIKPNIYSDERGFFLETFQALRYEKLANINLSFVQDNYSRSKKNVLRGLHYQKTKKQGKLVRVVKGEVFDVAIDLRRESSSYARWYSVILSEENKKQLWIPPGFAHGFLVISEFADFEYKCTNYYDPKDEGNILWNDPYLNIRWPIDDPILSEKDRKAGYFNNLKL